MITIPNKIFLVDMEEGNIYNYFFFFFFVDIRDFCSAAVDKMFH